MKRVTLLLVGAVALVTVLLVAGIAWLLASEAGARIVVARVAALAPSQIEYSGVHGDLLDGLTISQLRVSAGDSQIAITDARSALAPWSLLRGEIALPFIKVDSVVIVSAADATAGNAEKNGDSDSGNEAGESSELFSLPEPTLPFDLHVENIEIHELRIGGYEQGEYEALTFKRITARELGFHGLEWAVFDLSYASGGLSGSGHVTYTAGADHDLRIKLNNRVQHDEKYTEIYTELSGNDERLELAQRFEGVLRGEITGALLDPLGDALLTVSAKLHSDESQAISPRLPKGDFALSLSMEGQRDGLRARGTVSGLVAGEGIAFDAQVEDLQEQPVITAFTIRDSDGPAKLMFSGALRPLGVYPEVEGELRWSALRWPRNSAVQAPIAASPSGVFQINGAAGRYSLSGEADLENASAAGALSTRGEVDFSAPLTTFSLSGNWDALELRALSRTIILESGEYSLAGNLDNYRFQSALTARTPNSPEVRVRLSGQGSLKAIEISDLTAAADEGQLQGQGRLSLNDDRDFEFLLAASNIDTGAFDARWPGQIGLRGKGSGRLGPSGANASITLDDLSGRLRGLPVRANGSLTTESGALSQINVSGSWGQSELIAQGSIGVKRDVRWRLSIPDLADHTERGTGRLVSEGRLEGTQEQPAILASVTSRNLAYLDLRAEQLDLTARIQPSNAQSSSLSAAGRSVRWKGESADVIDLEVSGTQAEHRGSLTISRPDESLQALFNGAWVQQRWRGEVTETSVTLADTNWQQKNPASLAIDKTGIALGRFCLAEGSSQICAQADVPGVGKPEIIFEIIALPITKLATLLPPGLSYTGNISGEARLSGDNGTARIDFESVKIWQDVADEQQVFLDYRILAAKATLADSRVELELEGTEPGQQEMRLRMNLPMAGWQVGKGPISGRIEGSMENLGAAEFLFPDLGDLNGRVQADLVLGGSTVQPSWSGELVLANGQASVPSLGISLSSVSGRLLASGRRLSGEILASSGDGSLQLSGSGEPESDGIKGRFQLRGDNFLAAQLPEARVVLSPEIDATVDGRDVSLSGKVRIDEARIEPRDLSAAVQKSPDARVIDTSGDPVSEERWAITSKVLVSLSDKVFFKAFGLDAQVAGSLTVADAPNAVTTATGELETVDGTYEVYGRQLEIRRGRLLFGGGPLANPGLDVMATRSIDAGLEVGVLVRDNLKSPMVTLYSEPSLPPSQVLSYLLVGQPLADIGSADRQLVNDTASRLASAGGGLLAQQLGRRLGLEDVTISSSASGEQAALVIGKYLSPKLYASYGVGLFEPVTTLRLRYLLSSKWTIRAESGLNQSVDLEYSLER